MEQRTNNQEAENVEKTKRLRNANNAKRILAEPLMQEFFKTHTDMCVEAFKNLPMGSTIEEYQTVHHDMLAIERLKNTLKNYVTDYQIIVSSNDKI